LLGKLALFGYLFSFFGKFDIFGKILNPNAGRVFADLFVKINDLFET